MNMDCAREIPARFQMVKVMKGDACMQKNEFYFDSMDHKTQLHAVEWIPDDGPVCILQIVHGMAEYIDRYDRFAKVCQENGILVVGHDHLGHGKSVYPTGTAVSGKGNPDHPYGYFCEKEAPDVLVEDVNTLRRLIQNKYPETPCFILGHSMGSFILRNYLGRYGAGLAGAIVMGTGMQAKGLLTVARTLIRILKVFQGEKHKSGLINVMAFGSNNARIKNARSAMDWLSRDAAEVAKYDADPLCGFTFTLNGFDTLFSLIERLHDPGLLKKVPADLPVLFVSGAEDPVGEYGKAVERVYRSFVDSGIKNAEMKLYESDRHEILNELDRDAVSKEICSWIVNLRNSSL